MDVSFYRRVVFTAFTLAEWCLYTMVKDKLVSFTEKQSINTGILPKLQFWLKNLEKVQNAKANDDRENAGGFFFDILYLSNHLHPDDYEEVKNKYTEIINDVNKQRMSSRLQSIEVHNERTPE